MRRQGRGPLGGEAATARGRSPEARAFFAPGNPAIARQALLISIRACAAALALIGIADVLAAHLVGARLHEPSIILTAVWILVVCLARLALGRETDASRSREARRIRRALLEHAFRLGPARIGAEETGRLISLLTDSVERVVEYRQAYIGELIGAVATPFLALVVVGALIDPVAALVLVACIPFVPLSIGLFQRFVRDDSSASREMRARLSAQFLEAIQGLPTLVGIGAADRVGERLARTGEDNRLAVMRVLARNQLILFVMEGVFSLFLVAAAIVVSWIRLGAGAIDPAGALGLVLVSPLLTAPITQVGGFFYIGMGGRAGMRAMGSFLSRTAADAAPRSAETAASAPSRGEGARSGAPSVNLIGAAFGYSPETPVLSKIDLEVGRGECATLVGASGAGKSTLLSLLSGDLLPTAGDVRINGVGLTAGNQAEIRSMSAVMRQHTWLFTGTLGYNVRIGRASASDEEVWAAIDAVGLGPWARALPQGLDTHVGERAAAVSGGQAQRLSLARAIVSGRDLLICDEPTSQIDRESEALIREALERLSGERTVILSTHRRALEGMGKRYRVSEGRIERETDGIS